MRRYFEKTGQPHRLVSAWQAVLDRSRSGNADIDRGLWDDALTCAKQYIVPAMQALAFLTHNNAELERQIREAARDTLDVH